MGTRDAYEKELARLLAEEGGGPQGKHTPIDWAALMNRETNDVDWLVEDIWPAGRHIHLHAARKVGKSLLSLWIAAHLAIGKEPFTGVAIPARVVGYWDFEMTEDDIRERVEDMALPWEQMTNLHYYLQEPLPSLDTEKGGRELLEQTLALGEQAVVIDTMSRVVEGNENDSGTYTNFYRFTGQPLKSGGVSMFRLDHEGHLEGRSRGSSAKADDVDVVWQLRAQDDGYQLLRKASRISWVPETVSIQKSENPHLHFTRAAAGWPEGTKEKAKELDAAEVPLDASRRKAAELLKLGGFSAGKATVLGAALKYRAQKVVWP